MAPSAPLFLEKCPPISVPPAQALRWVKDSFLYAPGGFQTAASVLYLCGAVCHAVPATVGTPFPLSLPALLEPSH